MLCIASLYEWYESYTDEHVTCYRNLLYKFKQEATKTNCCVKGEDEVDHSTVTRWFKNKSGEKHSESIRRNCHLTIGRSGERGSGIPMTVAQHDDDDDDLSKNVWSCSTVPYIPKILHNFWLTLVHCILFRNVLVESFTNPHHLWHSNL